MPKINQLNLVLSNGCALTLLLLEENGAAFVANGVGGVPRKELQDALMRLAQACEDGGEKFLAEVRMQSLAAGVKGGQVIPLKPAS